MGRAALEEDSDDHSQRKKRKITTAKKQRTTRCSPSPDGVFPPSSEKMTRDFKFLSVDGEDNVRAGDRIPGPRKQQQPQITSGERGKFVELTDGFITSESAPARLSPTSVSMPPSLSVFIPPSYNASFPPCLPPHQFTCLCKSTLSSKIQF